MATKIIYCWNRNLDGENISNFVLSFDRECRLHFWFNLSKMNFIVNEGTSLKTASTDIFLLFLNIFFSFYIQEKPFLSKERDSIWEHALSFCFFFATFFRKDFAQWNNAMSPKSNIFPNQNAPSHKKIQNMETKKKQTY